MDKIESKRQLRVGKEIKKLMLELFHNSDLKFNNKLVSFEITKVIVSKDIRNIKLLIDIFDFDDNDKRKILKELNKMANKEIRQFLVPHLKHYKYMPEFIFFLDDGRNKQNKIEEIIEKEAKLFDESSRHC